MGHQEEDAVVLPITDARGVNEHHLSTLLDLAVDPLHEWGTYGDDQLVIISPSHLSTDLSLLLIVCTCAAVSPDLLASPV